MEHTEVFSKQGVIENGQTNLRLYLNFANSMVNYFLSK